MENVFEEAVTDNTSVEEPVLGEEYNLDLESDDEEEVTAETESTSEEGATDIDNYMDSPTNQAFAQMRTQNKEYSTKLNELDAIAKAAGLRDVDELIARSKEAQIKQQAKEEGIPESVARELAEMREFREEIKQRDIQQEYQAREENLVRNLEDFISKNNLSGDSVKRMSDELMRDGLTNDYLMDLPKAALNKVLSAYAGTSTQKLLEKKEAIKSELPLDQTSQTSNETINKQIDDLARQFAGK